MKLNPAVAQRTWTATERVVRVLRVESGGQRDRGRSELTALEVLDQGPAEDSAPSLEVAQLLRYWPQRREEGHDLGQHSADMAGLAVRAGDGDRGLIGMPGLPAYAVQQQRPAGDRLGVLVRVGQPHEQAPPVVDQRDDPSHQPATLQILGGEAAPAPVILQLIEIVFARRPVAISWATVKTSSGSDVTSTAYSNTLAAGSAVISPKYRSSCRPESSPVSIASVRSIGRRSRITRRCRLQPTSRKVDCLPCQPWPAVTQPGSAIARSISRCAFLVSRSLKRYGNPSRSARLMSASVPQSQSPRNRHGQAVRPSRASNAHKPGAECFEACWFPA